MVLSRVDLYYFMIFSIIFIEAGLNPEKDNVCLKTVTYNETVKIIMSRPASKRNKMLCLKERKYCEQEITTDKIEPQVITRTKILPSCCEGYEEDPEGTQCVPVCPKGCGNGKCVAPGKCTCEPGFFGSECEKVCDEGRWGENCLLECNCSENEVCNKFFGCMCKPGWIGESCKTPCPVGYYGFLCEEKCACAVNFCDHESGRCIESKKALNILPTGERKINGKHNTESSNVNIAINQTLAGFTKEDLELAGSNSSTDASLNEVLDETVTAIVSESDEAATPNPTYFKSREVEEGEKVKDLVQAKSSISAQETKFKPAQDLADAVKSPNIPTVLNDHENTNKIDILKELAPNLTGLQENTFRTNELFNPASNGQVTAAGNVESSRASNFIPTFTVLSGVSVLMILIAGKWLVIAFRKKIKKMANVELGCYDEESSILPGEKFTWENNLENPVYAPDIIDVIPTLQTFKPLVETKNVAMEKKINLAAE